MNSKESNCPFTLIYIHGRADEDPQQEWLSSLNTAIRSRGRGNLNQLGFVVLAPEWLEVLNDESNPGFVPDPLNTYELSDDFEEQRDLYNDASNDLRDHLRAERLLDHEPGVLSKAPDPVKKVAARGATSVWMRDVGRYLSDRSHRNRCVHRVLAQLPAEGNAVILAHSLGSVMAADLIYLLPPGLNLRMLITIGSPLGIPGLAQHARRLTEQFPYDRAGPWINLVGSGDPVGANGIQRAFPEVLDIHVRTDWNKKGWNPQRAHKPWNYLGQRQAAEALIWLADRGAEPARTEQSGVRHPQELAQLLFAFQFALRIEQQMEPGDAQQRFSLAREQRAEQVARDLETNRPEFKVSAKALLQDNQSQLGGIATSDRIRLLLLAAVSNPVEPFEVDYPPEVRPAALACSAVDLGGLESWGAVIEESLTEAESAQSEGLLAWRSAGLIAGGLLLVAVAPFAVIAAAPPGLAGGAAVMAGLAALGPGGAGGGMALLGVLGASGGAVATYGLATASKEEVQQAVILTHALALACKGLDDAQGERIATQTLQEMKSEVDAELERQEPISDSSSKKMSDLKKKQQSVERALSDLEDKGYSVRAS